MSLTFSAQNVKILFLLQSASSAKKSSENATDQESDEWSEEEKKRLLDALKRYYLLLYEVLPLYSPPELKTCPVPVFFMVVTVTTNLQRGIRVHKIPF